MRSLAGSACTTLRHTAASQAAMAGENLPLLGKFLGHNRHCTTGEYAHLSDNHRVEAAEKIGQLIADSMFHNGTIESTQQSAYPPYF